MTEQKIYKRAQGFADKILETVPFPLLLLDAELVLEGMNLAFCEKFRFSSDDYEGKPLPDLGPAWGDRELCEKLARVHSDHKDFVGFPFEGDFAIGHRSFLLNGTRLKGIQEGERFIVLSFEDVTEFQGHILELTRERDDERGRHQITLEQLRHSNRLGIIGRLTAGVAHELGSPLNVVLAQASLLKMEGVLTEDMRDDLTVIEDQARKMATLIRGLLDFSRINKESAITLNLREALEHTIKVLKPLSKKLGVTVELVSSCDDPVLINGDQFGQVMTNLLVNAFDAQPNGGCVRVSVAEPGELKLSRELGEGFLVVSVCDDGPGVPKDLRDSILSPFFTTKPVGKGTGLGLSVCQSILQEASGFLELSTDQEKGCCFHVVLRRG
ncbi:MAG: ATP-binding protein [Planctomycetota bacterium]|nr:ATP-binding protein [Planctomycetota bacterium]